MKRRRALPRRLTWRGRLFVFLLAAAVLYVLGFALFVVTMPKPFTTMAEKADGLAVFTGGFGRVDAALAVMHQGFHGPILISGLHPQTRLADIIELAGPQLALTTTQQQQITLDNAQTTQENIASLKTWAAKKGLRHIAIITSTYHAARVHFLGYLLTPELTLTLLPVQPANATLPVLLHEYNKLIAAPFLH